MAPIRPADETERCPPTSTSDDQEAGDYLVSRNKKSRNSDYMLFSSDALVHIAHDAKVSEKYTWLGERLRLTFKMMRSDSRLIRTMCHSHGFMQCSSKNPSVNVIWMGAPVKSVRMRELMPWQRLNQFPRSTELTKKDRLYENIERSKSIFGESFDFIPEFYVTPRENRKMENAFVRVAKEIAAAGGELCFPGEFIVKPTNSRQGKGIFFANSMADIPAEGPLLVSRYLKDPYLVNNHKFDLRIYVAVTSFYPLVAYVYSEGLARLASRPYDTSASSADSNEYVHLTNYSINKNSTSFVRNESMSSEDLGHKWTLGALLRYVENEGKDAKLLMLRIEDLIVKSLLSIQNSVATASRTNLRFACTNFELFGFDVLVDQALKPWLLEVNLSPSLACDAPLDSLLKTRLIADLLNLACVPLLDRKIIDSVTPALRKSMNSQESESSETDDLELDPMCAKTLKRRPVGLKRSVLNKKIVSGSTSLIPNNEKKFDQIVRKAELEDGRRGDFIRVFPRNGTWGMYSPVMEDLGNEDFDERLFDEVVTKKNTKNSSGSSKASSSSASASSSSSSMHIEDLSDLFHEVMMQCDKYSSIADVPIEIREIISPWYEEASEYTKKITQEGETYACKLPVIRSTARLRTKSCAEFYEVRKVQLAKKKESEAMASKENEPIVLQAVVAKRI
ncbi:Tubulin polyglutamylase ttll-5 [Caenorhabditis elegans]|nr:Tubulin polyglutamylase ttll-5 [Caenorhabditis elegans]CAB02862.3 Tubulin polyglutamylase ttll-5 [Caenorhabditis elegans]|eukprot:NP_001256332.1 Tubulin Tyrosine Ligase Like [Caenorhabditis elegans]